MSGIELILRQRYEGLLDASALLPERLLTMSLSEIEHTTIHVGGRICAVGDLFSVVSTDSDCLSVQGPVISSCRWGHEMTAGHLIIESDVGDETGLLMRGGVLEIRGNSGSKLGCGLRNGRIHVSGNAGDYVGSPPIGQRRGMRGGVVVIEGNVGQRLGDCMRRGTLIVHGNAGDFAAARMIAGTIAVCGEVGKQTGALMRRGTLWAPRLQPENIASNFTEGQRVQVPHLALWYRWLAALDTRFSEWPCQGTYAQRWLGDRAVHGLGELLSPPLS